MRQHKEPTLRVLRQEPLLIIYVDARDVCANDSKLLAFVNIRARQRRLCHNVLRVACHKIAIDCYPLILYNLGCSFGHSSIFSNTYEESRRMRC